MRAGGPAGRHRRVHDADVVEAGAGLQVDLGPALAQRGVQVARLLLVLLEAAVLLHQPLLVEQGGLDGVHLARELGLLAAQRVQPGLLAAQDALDLFLIHRFY